MNLAEQLRKRDSKVLDLLALARDLLSTGHNPVHLIEQVENLIQGKGERK